MLTRPRCRHPREAVRARLARRRGPHQGALTRTTALPPALGEEGAESVGALFYARMNAAKAVPLCVLAAVVHGLVALLIR